MFGLEGATFSRRQFQLMAAEAAEKEVKNELKELWCRLFMTTLLKEAAIMMVVVVVMVTMIIYFSDYYDDDEEEDQDV